MFESGISIPSLTGVLAVVFGQLGQMANSPIRSFISGLTSSSTRISTSEGSVDCTDVFLDQIEEKQNEKI